MTVVIISVGSVTSRTLTLTCNPFPDLPSSCFSHNLSSNCSPIGLFCLVQSPPPTLRLLATLILIHPLRALATTSSKALTYRLILLGSVTSPYFAPGSNSISNNEMCVRCVRTHQAHQALGRITLQNRIL